MFPARHLTLYAYVVLLTNRTGGRRRDAPDGTEWLLRARRGSVENALGFPGVFGLGNGFETYDRLRIIWRLNDFTRNHVFHSKSPPLLFFRPVRKTTILNSYLSGDNMCVCVYVA